MKSRRTKSTKGLSRKEFLGLLGAGAGAMLLPSISTAEPAPVQPGLAPIIPNRKTRISFRYFLPWAPAWGDQKFADQRLEELVAFGHEAAIDSIQFFVNTFRHSYYALPVDVESQQPWIDWMRDVVAPRIRAEGFGFELNFQQLLGATTSNTDLRPLYKWKQYMVDDDGETSRGSPCPFDPIYRQEMSKMLRGWAGTRPDILWIDDDFRLHNHSTNGMYCYCPLHLKQFTEKVGKEMTRPEILKAVLQTGKPSEMRGTWLDFLGDCMADFAQWIADQVHSQSPGTRVALMTSGTNIHSLEGRDWKKVLGNFAAPYKPLIRPTFGLYTGTTAAPKSASAGLTSIISQMQVVEQSLGPDGCDFAPELENTRYTTWAKSVAHSTHSIIMAQLMGLPMITAAVNDLDGSPIAEEPTTVALFRNARPRMEALAALDLKHWPIQGLVALSDKDIARKTQLAGKAGYEAMAPGSHLESVLAQMGVPLNYKTAATVAADDVVLLEAGSVWLADDAELKSILAGAVFMTSAAARMIVDRGFGDDLGVKIGSHRTQGIQSEEYVGGILPGVHECRVPHRGMDWDELTVADPRAQVPSYFCDMLGEKHIGTALYRNPRGGRVAIYAQNSDMQGGLFGSHARLRWLHGVLAWLSDGNFAGLPVIPQHGISVLKNGRGRWMYAFCNLGADPLTEFRLRWKNASTIRSITSLKDDGSWKSVEFQIANPEEKQGSLISLPVNLNCYGWLVLLIDQPG